MQNTFQVMEFERIIDKLTEYAMTEQAKERLQHLRPYLSEAEVQARLRETSEARKILDQVGTPPLSTMKDIDRMLVTAEKGGMLLPEELEQIAVTLTGIRRLKDFLGRCKYLEVGMAYYADDLDSVEDLREEIARDIRNGYVDDAATSQLKDVRQEIERTQLRIREKADRILRNNKELFSDSFVSNRNGHLCLPVKKECKSKVDGSVIDKSSTGSTLFIEPAALAKMNEALQVLKIEEDNEERKILYTLSALVAEYSTVFAKNLQLAAQLDFAFAKGKLSIELEGVLPTMNTTRKLRIIQGRHPLLEQTECVPLDFELVDDIRGIVITGPNTGGKTVAIKTIGLLSMMAQSGLHVPCKEADICMNSQVLCDIGDGQNIAENLSTFSAHIKNVLYIMEHVDKESLVILDELGSGTDPAEGMGIAIAILEELRKSGCNFVATTHYPEVKNYAEQAGHLMNARMAFDRETLEPLYRLELGKAGKSCAFHIAKRLGMSGNMLARAAKEAYGENSEGEWTQEPAETGKATEVKAGTSAIIKRKQEKIISDRAGEFQIGDSVLVYPDKKNGIVCKKADGKGQILIQMKKEKLLVNHKRLKLHVAAAELYPEDYDFSILFDSVENRKARHQMNKGHRPDLEILMPF